MARLNTPGHFYVVYVGPRHGVARVMCRRHIVCATHTCSHPREQPQRFTQACFHPRIFASMQNTIQIKILVDEAAVSDLLIAQLNDMGYEGFEEEVGQLLAFCNEEVFNEEPLQETLKEYALSYEKSIIQP